MSLNSTAYSSSSVGTDPAVTQASGGDSHSSIVTFIAVTIVIGVASFIFFVSLALLFMDRRKKYRMKLHARQQHQETPVSRKRTDDQSSTKSDVLPEVSHSDEECSGISSSINSSTGTFENNTHLSPKVAYSFFIPNKEGLLSISSTSSSNIDKIPTIRAGSYSTSDPNNQNTKKSDTVSLKYADEEECKNVPVIIALRNMAVSLLYNDECGSYPCSYFERPEDISSCSTDSGSSSMDSGTPDTMYSCQTNHNHSSTIKLEDPSFMSSLSGGRSSMISTLERLESLVANIRAVQLRNLNNPPMDESTLSNQGVEI